MQFDTKSRGSEFAKIDHLNPRLRAFLLWLDERCLDEFGRDICITSFGRTVSQNKKAGESPNSFDLIRPVCTARIRGATGKWFTRLQQDQICEWFNHWHACRTGDKCLAKKNYIYIQMEFSPNINLEEEVEIIGVI